MTLRHILQDESTIEYYLHVHTFNYLRTAICTMMIILGYDMTNIMIH